MADEAPATSIYERIAQAARKVEGVEKDARNDQQHYDYVSAEALLRKVRGPLLEAGLILSPQVRSVDRELIGQAKSGAPRLLTTLHLAFLVVDVKSGESVTHPWVGTGEDSGDKGVYKAYTGAIKTFLRSLLLLPMGDDPEKDGPPDPAVQAPKPTSAPAKPTEKLASAQQRGLVNGKAGEKGLTAERLANLILLASGAPTRELDEEHAKKLVDRLLDRLPARLVDPVLEGIEGAAE